MQTSKNRRLTAELAFILGVLLAVSGVSALLYSVRTGRLFMLILAGMVMVCSLIFFRLATSLRKNPRYFFVASFSSISSLFLFLRFFDVIESPLAALWPLLVVTSGLSLFAAGYFAYRKLTIRILVPSLAFVFLGAFFLLFSFDILNFSFKAFFLQWWPLFILFSGLLLLLVSFCESKK